MREIALSILIHWIVPLLLVVAVAAVAWWITRRIHPDTHAGRISQQVTKALIVIFAVVALILALPFPNETTGQLLSLFGLAVTAVIALSSTTFVANTMAGMMLRIVRSYRVGDFIRVGEDFGRVTERAVLHTEIQTEDRDLITLPNLYLITHPVRVVRRTGTILSADVSLGFDVSRSRISRLLKEAAERAELQDPFVQILEIGDFSVVYRVSGFLEDVSRMVSTRSHLKGQVMDCLHEDGIEIVSPTFMNQRQVPEPQIPRKTVDRAEDQQAPEAIMFDKAEVAERFDRLATQRDKLVAEIAEIRKDDEKDDARKELETSWRERQVALLDEALAAKPKEVG